MLDVDLFHSSPEKLSDIFPKIGLDIHLYMSYNAYRCTPRQKEAKVRVSTTKPRMMITLDPDMLESLDRLKREIFYNQPKSKMIQYLIREGIRATNDALEAQDMTAQH